jgi:hypothetical protein
MNSRCRYHAIRHVGNVRAWNLPHGLDDLGGQRGFFDDVFTVSQSPLQLFGPTTTFQRVERAPSALGSSLVERTNRAAGVHRNLSPIVPFE